MSFNLIISTLTTGFIFWLVGIERNSKVQKLIGATLVLISIILNMLSQFKMV